MAVWIKAATQEMVEVKPASGKAFTLEEMQKAVGGHIEAIQLRDGRIMWLNEEGKLDGLPLNAIATDMARRSGLAPSDHIVGDALVTTREEAGEDDEEEERLTAPEVCPRCGASAIARLQGDEWACHACGKTFTFRA